MSNVSSLLWLSQVYGISRMESAISEVRMNGTMRLISGYDAKLRANRNAFAEPLAFSLYRLEPVHRDSLLFQEL